MPREISLSDPTVLDASTMDHRDLVAAVAKGDGPFLIKNAHDMGFMSDHLLVVPGGKSKVSGVAVANSPHTPVLTKGMFANALHMLSR